MDNVGQGGTVGEVRQATLRSVAASLTATAMACRAPYSLHSGRARKGAR
ncbi:DUF6380 family protein [Streptomyces sp. NPDC046805]